MAEDLKRCGNECFVKGKLEAAIEAYTEAISLAPGVAVYHTNRAMCFLKKQNWERVISDCRTALELDRLSIKAHYLLGLALSSIAEHAVGISHLRQALELCKESTVSYKDDILRALLAARKREWEAGRAARTAQLEAAEAALAGLHPQPSPGDGMDCSSGHSSASGAAGSAAPCLAEALGMLRRSWEPRRVPEHLCCQISMEPMLDPVTTPCGVSYERGALEEVTLPLEPGTWLHFSASPRALRSAPSPLRSLLAWSPAAAAPAQGW